MDKIHISISSKEHQADTFYLQTPWAWVLYEVLLRLQPTGIFHLKYLGTVAGKGAADKALIAIWKDKAIPGGGGKQTQFLGQTASPSFDVNRHLFDMNLWNKDFKTKFRKKGRRHGTKKYLPIEMLISDIVQYKVIWKTNCLVCKLFFFLPRGGEAICVRTEF